MPIIRPTLILLLLCAAASPAGAAAAEAWNHYCITDLDTEETLCTTELSATYNGVDFVFYFAHTTEGDPPFVAAGPDRLYHSMTVKVDDKAALSADSCEVGLCYFEAEKSGTLLRQFLKGRKALIVIEGTRREISFDHEITLVGFSNAFFQQ